jgi:glutamine phosphoribosylpyrophosphate amidotransferase
MLLNKNNLYILVFNLNILQHRGEQSVGSVQTEINTCIQSFFGLSNYEPNQTYKNMNRINRNFIQLNQNYIS